MIPVQKAKHTPSTDSNKNKMVHNFYAFYKGDVFYKSPSTLIYQNGLNENKI